MKRFAVQLVALAALVVPLSAAAAVTAVSPGLREALRLVDMAITLERQVLRDGSPGRNTAASLRNAVNALTLAERLARGAGLKAVASKLGRARAEDSRAHRTFANLRATKAQIGAAELHIEEALPLKQQARTSILRALKPPPARLELRSSAFENNGTIPAQFSCEGPSPPLQWTEPPAGTQSFALIVEDPDAPGGLFTHWLTWGIPASARALGQGKSGPVVGRGDAGQRWLGPCPPPGAPHRYIFRLYALEIQLTLAAGATRSQLLAAMQGRILAQAELTGLFGR